MDTAEEVPLEQTHSITDVPLTTGSCYSSRSFVDNHLDLTIVNKLVRCNKIQPCRALQTASVVAQFRQNVIVALWVGPTIGKKQVDCLPIIFTVTRKKPNNLITRPLPFNHFSQTLKRPSHPKN